MSAIACSIAISLFTALTLAPPLSALLLGQEHAPTSAIFRAINWVIAKLRSSYHALLPRLIKQRLVVFGVFVLALGVTGATYSRTPSAFIPDEDQSYLIVVLQAPAGTSSDFERRVSARVAARIRAAVPEARGVFSVDGFGFTGNAPNRGIAFIPLKPWNERAGSEHTFRAILKRLAPIVASEPDAQVFAFNPPSVQGIGNFGGFQFQVLDQGDIGFTKTMAGVRSLIGAVNSDPHFAAGFTSFRTDTPQFNLQINRDKAETVGVPFGDVAQTLGIFEGSQYINDFDYLNRSYRVYLQADTPYRGECRRSRADVRSLERWRHGAAVFAGLADRERIRADGDHALRPLPLDRDRRRATPDVGSGDAISAMNALAKANLGPGLSTAWFGLSRDQIEGGNVAALVFALGIVFVFLVLAAQYENLWDPFIILLSVPLALLGALWAIGLRGMPSDVFVQVGLVMQIGLASKNAILIVEFANQLRESGLDAVHAVISAAETRLRPILMTSLAFIFGILPLVWATGAGSARRNSLGTAVLGGMLLSTALNLIFVPVLYVLVAGLREQVGRRVAASRTPHATSAVGAARTVSTVSGDVVVER